jgi:hypothetical protein
MIANSTTVEPACPLRERRVIRLLVGPILYSPAATSSFGPAFYGADFPGADCVPALCHPPIPLTVGNITR